MIQSTHSLCNLKLQDLGISDTSDVSTRSIRAINKIFRERDESNLFPINGAFNATERAIRWYSRVYFQANGPCSNLEYILGLESKISEYVNSGNY
jgi:hypothetical protein